MTGLAAAWRHATASADAVGGLVFGESIAIIGVKRAALWHCPRTGYDTLTYHSETDTFRKLSQRENAHGCLFPLPRQ
jgi:hypothetical protein